MTTMETAAANDPRTTPEGSGRSFVAPTILLAALAVAGIALSLSEGDTGGSAIARASLSALWAFVGVIVARRKPAEPLGLLAAAGALVGSAGSLGAALPTEMLRWAALGLIAPLGAHLVMALPTGRLLKRAHRGWVITLYVLGAAVAAGSFLTRPAPSWPVVVLAVFCVSVALGISNARYQRARGLDRQRMQWFGWAVTVGCVIATLAVALGLLLGWPDDAGLAAAVATSLIPVSLVLGTSSRFSARVDRLLEHTVAFGGLTALIVAIYLIVVLGLGRVPSHTERTLLALSMTAAAVAALLYVPTRDRLHDIATRIVYGERHAPDEVLRTFGSRMSRAVPLDELLLQMSESLRKTFDLDAVEVWTGKDGSLSRFVSDPERGPGSMQIGPKELPVLTRAGVTGPAWIKVWLPHIMRGREESMIRLAPIAHQGELLGMIVAERRQSADAFGEEGERVLTELARTIGIALHNVQLDTALQASLDELRKQAEQIRESRQRIVQAGDAERRKLERDLHDGAQQHFVALAVKLNLVKQLIEADPDAAKAMATELREDIQEGIQQLRDFSHGIFPPLLADQGLPAALRSIAQKAVLPASVEAGESVGRYRPEVEGAIYFLCSEALQNAGKHAGEGAGATIRLDETEGALVFEIADDGAGFAMSEKGLGAGFTNMDDRVGAVGGTLSVESAPGQGTKISARIPVIAARA